MEQIKYLAASEVAEMLGGKWSRSMVHTYLKRGKFPTPITYVGNRPLWTVDQIKKFKKGRGIV